VSKDRLLTAAIELIAERGEAKLRLADVAERAGTSIGAVQHHFRNRERLVAQAQVERFIQPARRDITAIRELLENAETADEVRVALAAVTRSVVDRTRSEQRMARLSSLSAVHGRPDARAVMTAELSRLTEEFADAIRGSQTKGFVRQDIDPMAISVFVQAYALGMAIADMVEPASGDETLASVIDLFVTSILVEPPT
jgi:AcrR family transcriptional regulator